jgi:DNA-binding HxlR family transcriptional regulator
MILLRDAYRGVDRFDDFQAMSGIAKTVLTRRLAKLVDEGLMRRELYCEAPPRHRYVLTDAGHDAFGIFMEMLGWGDRQRACSLGPPMLVRHVNCGQLTLAAARCTSCGEQLTSSTVQFEKGAGAVGPEVKRMGQVMRSIAQRDASRQVNDRTPPRASSS